jgi:glycosyltransferase involved in cell wall biosynthesis
VVKVSESISIVLPNLCGGGAERVAVNLANGFIRRGFMVEMILLSASGVFLADLDPNIQVVDLKVRRLRGALLPLARYLRLSRPDALLAFMWPLTVIALWACWLARTRTRVVVAEHTTWSRDEIVRSFYARWLVRITMHFSFCFADAVIAVSRGAADDLARVARLDREEIHVVYNPVVGEAQIYTDLPQAPEGWWFGPHSNPLKIT